MRLIATFPRQDDAAAFVHLLKMEEVPCHLEAITDEDPLSYQVWVYEEDHVAQANQLFEEFQADPEKAKKEHKKSSFKGIPKPDLDVKPKPQAEDSPADHRDDEGDPFVLPKEEVQGEILRLTKAKIGIRMKTLVTKLLVGICVLVFFLSMFQRQALLQKTSASLFFPLITPIQAVMLYEYPEAMELNNQLIHDYQFKNEEEMMQLPEGAQSLIQEIEAHPPWFGIYDVIVAYFKGEELKSGPLFPDLRKGEVWRLVTPIFLHGDLLHILFNMLWLWLLGRLIEVRLGALRYILMIILIAIVSNTIQYLMSGPLFMGFSGVICGMAGYIWMRQIVAPWEVYPIHKAAITFLWIFIFGMFLIQVFAFFFQIFNIVSLNLRIANAAHISGALMGMILARIPIFNRSIL